MPGAQPAPYDRRGETLVAHLKGELGVDRAALLEYWVTEQQCT
jgi:hypothetical protein